MKHLPVLSGLLHRNFAIYDAFRSYDAYHPLGSFRLRAQNAPAWSSSVGAVHDPWFVTKHALQINANDNAQTYGQLTGVYIACGLYKRYPFYKRIADYGVEDVYLYHDVVSDDSDEAFWWISPEVGAGHYFAMADDSETPPLSKWYHVAEEDAEPAIANIVLRFMDPTVWSLQTEALLFEVARIHFCSSCDPEALRSA